MVKNLIKINQNFPSHSISDLKEQLRLELIETFTEAILPGARIGIAVGSRGINQLATTVKALITFIKEKGGHPFIFPAMGSHGGATVLGQKSILTSYGITEKTMDVPIEFGTEVVEIPGNGLPNQVYMNKHAYASDGVILINRIKPHTDYHGTYESGLVKMSVIGVGSHAQALEMHKFGIYGLRELLPDTAERIFQTGKIIGGIALVEDAYDQTMIVKALQAKAIMREEPRLLKIAKDHMPSLPFHFFDVLIIKEMGKNISGVGMDSNIIGRIKIRGEPEPEIPNIKNIVVCDLTAVSHGNAIGVGLADVITQRLFDKMDYQITRENLITSSFLERGKIPLIAKNDQEAFDIALRSCGDMGPGQEKIMCIRNTLQLREVYISEAIYSKVKHNPGIQKVSDSHQIFNKNGALALFDD
jgi:hypothetical protein